MVFGPDNRSALPIFGEKAICVRDANFVRQVLYDGIAGRMDLTASGLFKRQHNAVAGGKPRFEIDHLYAAGGFIRRLSNTIFPTVPEDFSIVRHSLTFTIPDEFGEGDSLDFKISGGNNEWYNVTVFKLWRVPHHPFICQKILLGKLPRAVTML